VASSKNAIQVENLKQLQRALSKADKDMAKELRKLNKSAADVVKDDAKKYAPIGSSGNLAKSVTSQASGREAKVKVGSPSRVPYAGAVIYGFRNRPQGGQNWPPQPFLPKALVMKRDEVETMYEESLRELLEIIDSSGVFNP
jgi:hypothetical protein